MRKRILVCRAEDEPIDLYEFITGDLGYNIFTFEDFLFDKGEMSANEFRKCGLYPFRAFNFVALPGPRAVTSLG